MEEKDITVVFRAGISNQITQRQSNKTGQSASYNENTVVTSPSMTKLLWNYVPTLLCILTFPFNPCWEKGRSSI
jgi:hypothetical protein